MGNRRKFVKIFSLVIILVCLIQIGQACYLSLRYRAQLRELRKLTESEGQPGETGQPGTEELPEASEPQMEQENNQTEGGAEQTGEPVVLDKYAAVYGENDELAGWLSIEGMVIDYPVMQCEDDEYYLHHDFYGEESFYREHSEISFDTLYEERVYDIVAVFRSQVYNSDDDVFKYYHF